MLLTSQLPCLHSFNQIDTEVSLDHLPRKKVLHFYSMVCWTLIEFSSLRSKAILTLQSPTIRASSNTSPKIKFAIRSIKKLFYSYSYFIWNIY